MSQAAVAVSATPHPTEAAPRRVPVRTPQREGRSGAGSVVVSGSPRPVTATGWR